MTAKTQIRCPHLQHYRSTNSPFGAGGSPPASCAIWLLHSFGPSVRTMRQEKTLQRGRDRTRVRYPPQGALRRVNPPLWLTQEILLWVRIQRFRAALEQQRRSLEDMPPPRFPWEGGDAGEP